MPVKFKLRLKLLFNFLIIEPIKSEMVYHTILNKLQM